MLVGTPEIAFAAADADEAKLLAAVVGAYDDPDAYEHYATYLDGRDPARATAVRDLVRALTAGELPARRPRYGPLPVWSRMLGYDWHAALSKHSPEQRRRVAAWTRPVVTLASEPCPDDAVPAGASKFGGCPDMPGEIPWPECREGPLGFMAQLSFADLRGSVATVAYDLPVDGRLLLFAFDDPDEGTQPGVVELGDDGEYREIPDLARVIYVPGGTPCVRRALPDAVVASGRAVPPCRLVFSEDFDVPWAADCDDPVLQAEDVEEVLHELRRGAAEPSRLMGYPVHSRTQDVRPAPDWQSLVTLASDENANWCWSDGERLEVYITPDDLRARRFDRTYAYAS